jgi:hypothetical protein
MLWRENVLYFHIGEGNATLAGPAPGTEIVNPNPASPIFSALLALEFDPGVAGVLAGFTLPAAEHAALAAGRQIQLRSAAGDRAYLRVVMNFPDTVAEPRPNVPQNVRPSNPFGLEGSLTHFDVVDSGLNLIRRVDIWAGTERTLFTFAPVQNPTPVGAPVIDFVPTNARGLGDELIVSFLTGFPFPLGQAGARIVNPSTGRNDPLFAGFRMVTDVMPVGRFSTAFYVLEHSAGAAQGSPGRLSLIDAPGAAPVVVADGLTTPTGVAIEPNTGDLLVSELTTGQLMLVPAPR